MTLGKLLSKLWSILSVKYYSTLKNDLFGGSIIIWGTCLLNKNKAGFIIIRTVSSRLHSKVQMKIRHRGKNERDYTEMFSELSFKMKKKMFKKNPLVTGEYLCCAHYILLLVSLLASRALSRKHRNAIHGGEIC